jgi:hypothetical protein
MLLALIFVCLVASTQIGPDTAIEN